MNKEKINKIYCPIMFGFGLIAIFLMQMNVLIHFQWAVSIWSDVFAFIAVTLLAGIACFDMTFKVKRRNISVAIVSAAVAFLCLIAAIGNIVQIVKEDCGVFALVMNLITLAVSLFYAYLHFKVDDTISDASKKKKRLSRGFAIGGAAFVLICCIITPSVTAAGKRMGYPFDGCVEEQRCPVSYAITLAAHRGKLEKIEYESPVYTTDGNETENKVNKKMWIYLPYGYSDSKKYDVLYLIHGGGGNENTYFNGGASFSKFKNLFDHMIEDGKIKPTIVVTPCIGYNDARYDNIDTNTITFQYEMQNFIIPLVEQKYSTYADDVTKEGIANSRSHRMIAGFSYGGIATLNAFVYNLDKFSIFIPMSNRFNSPDDMIYSIEERFQNLYDTDDFKLAFCTGGREMDYPVVTNLYKTLTKQHGKYFSAADNFSDGNALLYIGTNHRHGSEFVMEYLYVYLPMMFGI